MILPIVAYGHPVLRKRATDITADYPQLEKLIADMWETLYNSNGVGLAAPQINRDIRLFLVDTLQMFENMEADEKADYPEDNGIKSVFINAKILKLDGDEWPYNEGCLSIPKIREDVYRNESVTINYLDENFQSHTQSFTGLSARV
ncbi:MAG TPA: peptide deformylase, partial [Chitinophagaceae bacterium]|nr:peptide deformylase [Chitinophagaceae bacterium]